MSSSPKPNRPRPPDKHAAEELNKRLRVAQRSMRNTEAVMSSKINTMRAGVDDVIRQLFNTGPNGIDEGKLATYKAFVDAYMAIPPDYCPPGHKGTRVLVELTKALVAVGLSESLQRHYERSKMEEGGAGSD